MVDFDGYLFQKIKNVFLPSQVVTFHRDSRNSRASPLLMTDSGSDNFYMIYMKLFRFNIQVVPSHNGPTDRISAVRSTAATT
jgi:hypothetical protein